MINAPRSAKGIFYMGAKPKNGHGSPSVVSVKRDTYRRMVEVRDAKREPTAAMWALFADTPGAKKP